MSSQSSNHGLDSIRSKVHNHPPVTTPLREPSSSVDLPQNESHVALDSSESLGTSSTGEVVEEQVFQLLEEKLVVNRNKRKLGEVIIRKEIGTRMVEVPVRWEKIVVERVGELPEQLAEVDLGRGEITGVELSERTLVSDRPTVSAEFTSVQKASKALNAIASQPRHGCTKIRIEIELEDNQFIDPYKNWVENYSDR